MVNWGDKFKDEKKGKLVESGRKESEELVETAKPIKERIDEMRGKLNLWEGFKFDRATDREIAKVAGELVVNQLNGEKEVVIDKIINNVALGKRENLKQFLADVAVKDIEIFRIGEETKKQLSYEMQKQIETICIEKKNMKNETKNLLDNNQIDQEDYENILLMHEHEALQLIDSKTKDRDTIKATYGKRIEQALSSYVERNPDYSKSKL